MHYFPFNLYLLTAAGEQVEELAISRREALSDKSLGKTLTQYIRQYHILAWLPCVVLWYISFNDSQPWWEVCGE